MLIDTKIQEYIPVGCVPTTAVAATRCQNQGSCLGGSAQRTVCLEGEEVCLEGKGVCLEGRVLPRGLCPPPSHGQTDRCRNITSPSDSKTKGKRFVYVSLQEMKTDLKVRDGKQQKFISVRNVKCPSKYNLPNISRNVFTMNYLFSIRSLDMIQK